MITFIVPVKNELAYTRALVQTVRRQNPSVEVEWVVVDSGSTDGTLPFCAEIGARVVPYRAPSFNYCAAVNLGAAEAHGEVWIIANNDLEFRSQGDLARLETAFRDWPLLAVVSPGRANGAAELEFVDGGINGACWAVRPEIFRAWGGMPESMSGYGYDEAYTTYQCWRRGYALGWLTGWDVLHHGSVTFGPMGGTTLDALKRNLLRLLEAVDARDLESAGTPEQIMQALSAREAAQAPCRLHVPGADAPWLQRQGYVNAKAGSGGCEAVVFGEEATRTERQWLPWLANELLLQPEAPCVGGQGWYAVREGARMPDAELRERARTVGPAAPVLMPPVAVKRASPWQRAWAAFHTWRSRRQKVPQDW